MGATGIIQNFEGEQVIFKPTNLDGFDDNLQISQLHIVKYFEQGDQVRVLDGKYKGETGMVTEVKNDIDKIKKDEDEKPSSKDKNAHHPIVKLDKSQRQLQFGRNNLKLKTDHDKDVQRLLDISQKQRGQQITGQFSSNPIDSMYRVGELILYNQGKIYGYILQVLDDFVKVINDQSCITKVRLSEIDKKIVFDRKAFTRDAGGHILLIDDVVKVVDGYHKGKKGIIKNI